MRREVALEARPGQEAITGVPEAPAAGMSVTSEPPGLRVTSPAPRGAWRELLAADADGLVTQSPEWLDALCAGGSYEDASRLYETDRGTRLVLPMVRRRGPWPFGLAPLASMPHAWGMGGFLADRRATQEDVAAIVADLASSSALRTKIRPNPLHDDDWRHARSWGAVAIPRCAHVVDLRGGVDEVWRGFRSHGRQGVRRAERSGLDVECDATGRLVPVFYELLQLSIERWASQQHEPLALARWRGRRRDPLEKFVRWAAALGDAMRVWVAWKDGSPAASIIVLQGANANDTRGAMNKELAGPTSANDLLEWLAIQDACRAGCRWFHLGESGSSPTLSRYKEKFGARPVSYSEYMFERLPLARADTLSRGLVKRVLRFRDA
jgi:hypothetical protein